MGLDYTGERLEAKEFDGCNFEQCKLVDCVLDRCAFFDCVFERCLLSPIEFLKCSFVDARFSDCKLIGVDWTMSADARGLSFTNCLMNYSTFNAMKLKGLKLLKCTCKEVEFTNSDLTNGDFEGTDFEKSIFSQSNLTNANFLGAINYWIDPRANIVKRARFSLPWCAFSSQIT